MDTLNFPERVLQRINLNRLISLEFLSELLLIGVDDESPQVVSIVSKDKLIRGSLSTNSVPESDQATDYRIKVASVQLVKGILLIISQGHVGLLSLELSQDSGKQDLESFPTKLILQNIGQVFRLLVHYV